MQIVPGPRSEVWAKLKKSPRNKAERSVGDQGFRKPILAALWRMSAGEGD